jgi:hypothetical protein
MSGMWDSPDCDTCGDGLRPWADTTPVSLDEAHPMDVGNREGVIGAGARRRIAKHFAGLPGFGQLAEDTPPAIDANPGAPGSDAGGDTGSTDPALNTVTSGAQTSNSTTGPFQSGTGPATTTTTTTTSSGGGGLSSDASSSGADYIPWVIGGALVLAAGVGAAVYLKKRRR